MKNALKNTNIKFILIGKINGLSGESKKTRNRIKKAIAPEKKWPLTYRKYMIGVNTRHHLLAYAFLRGVPYRKAEAKCGEFNKPNAGQIFKVIEQHAPSWIPYDPYTKTGGGTYTATLNEVNVWLTTPSEGL